MKAESRMLALLIPLTLIAGCLSPVEPVDDSFSDEYKYVKIEFATTSHSDGFCSVTGITARAEREAEWGRIAVTKYGRVWAVYDGAAFWGSNTIRPGEVQHARQDVQALTSGQASVTIRYHEPDGGRKRVRILTARC